MILVRRIAFTLQEQVDGLIKVEENRAAADVVVRTFVDPLTGGAGWVLAAIAVVAFVAIITGPYRWVASVRSSIAGLFRSAGSAVNDRANDDATQQWVARNVDALRIVGYVLGALALWVFDLSWLSLFLILAVVAGWQVVVAQLAGRAEGDGVDGIDEGDGGDGFDAIRGERPAASP
jgi:hypothetical protein